MLPEEARELGQAMSLLQTQQTEEASALLEQLAGRYPNQAEVPHLQAVLAMLAGDHATAATRFEQALELAPGGAHIHNNYANFLRSAGLPGRAIGHYELAVVLEPEHLEAHLNLGALLIETNPEQARNHLETAQRLRPSLPQAAYLLGLLGLHSGDYLLAIQSFTRSHQLGYETADCAARLAEIAGIEGAWGQALTLIVQALQEPDAPAHWHNLHGLILARLGQTGLARAAWDQALQLNPDFVPARISLAKADLDAGQYGPAADALRALLDRPDLTAATRADVFMALAHACAGLGDSAGDSACRSEAEALRQSPEYAQLPGLLPYLD